MKIKTKVIYKSLPLQVNGGDKEIKDFEQMLNAALSELGDKVVKIQYRPTTNALTTMITYQDDSE